MKTNKLLAINIIFFSLLLVTSNINLINTITSNQNTDKTSLSTISIPKFGIQYTETSPFSVNTAGLSSFPGNGSKSNPYIIEELNITSSSPVSLIYVVSVTKHFIIRNCYFSGGDFGITLDSSSNGTVYNNTFIGQAQHGVYLAYSANNTVSFNQINDTGNRGIHFYGAGSSHNIAFNNTIHTTREGINLWANHYGYIYNNTISNASIAGIKLQSSENNTIRQNHIMKSYSGIDLGSFAVNNTFTRNEIQNSTWYGFYNPASSAINNTVHENEIYWNSYGIYVSGNSVNSYSANIVHDNTYEGIYVQSAPNGTYINNLIYSNGKGMQFYATPRNEVINNTIYNNADNGIQITDSMSQYNNFKGNIIKNNSNHGIIFIESDYNNCTDNLIFKNQGHGIYILSAGSYNNSINSNDIIENFQQAFDEGTYNKFKNNFWSDHESSDPYISISGSASNQDLTPVLTAYLLPHELTNLVITSPVGGQARSDNISIEWNEVTDSWLHTVEYFVYYTLDLGNSWTLIVGGLSKTSVTWNTTNLDYAQNVKVNVTAIDGIISRSVTTSSFSIENIMHTLSKPTVLYPNGGELLNGTILIQWSPANDSWNHTIYYDVEYTFGITGWMSIFGGTDLTQTSFNWSTTSINYAFFVKIRVTAKDLMSSTAQDESDSNFNLQNVEQEVSEPTILFPNGGETISGVTSITWTPSDSTLGYDIAYSVYYSLDDGITWIILILDSAETSFNWDTSQITNGVNYLIKVSASDSLGILVEDQSDSPFTVQNNVSTSFTTTFTSRSTTRDTSTKTSKASPAFTFWLLLLIIPVISYRKTKK